MAKNMIRTRNANVVIPLVVAANTAAGEVVKIGAHGLTGYVLTDAYATFDATSGETYPQGIDEANEVSVELVGVSLVVDLEVAGGVAVGDAIYVAGAGVYNDTALDNDFIGWALAAIADGEVGPVGLASFTPAISAT